MATKVEVETRFGDLEMLFVEAPFDQAKTAIESAGGKLATAQQVAQARIVAGPDSEVSRYGSWVAENFVYLPSGKIFITKAKNSPILKRPTVATEAHRNGIEFHISEEEAASLEKLAVSGEVYTLKKDESYNIPIKKFAKDGLARFVFGDTAADYAKFLQEAGAYEFQVFLAGSKYQKEQKAPFAQALWLHYVYYRSERDGYVRNLYDDYWARGVRKASDQVSQKPADVANAYESIAQKYGLKSPDKLQDVLEKYSQIKGLVKE